MSSTRASRLLLAALPRAAWVTVFALVTVWVQQVEGGLGFSATQLFGWHAWLMTIAFPVLTTEALLAFASPMLHPSLLVKGYSTQRRWQKAAHIAMHVSTFVLIILGLVSIVNYKRLSPQPVAFPFYTLFSPHSWVGVITLSLWSLQFAAGLGRSWLSAWRDELARWHALLGKCVYVMALAACALGLQDMQSSDLSGGQYDPYSTFSLLAPAAAAMLAGLGVIVFVVLECKPSAAGPELERTGAGEQEA